jgi:hypothetical protein
MRPVAPGLAILLAFLVTPLSAAAAAWTLQESREFPVAQGRVARANVLTIDTNRANLRIVSVPIELRRPPGALDISLLDLAAHLEQKKPRDSSWAAFNGGFSSSRDDIPLGLLVVGGKVYSQLSREQDGTSSLQVKSEYSKYRWSGVLCQAKENGAWDIVPASRYRPGSCYQALQAGPVVVEPDGKVAIAPGESQAKRPYSRTVVCLSGSLMKVVVVSDRTHLYPLARWLSNSEAKGGLGCRVALNLSGDSSSGLVVQEPGRASLRLGDGSFPIPSAVIVEQKSRQAK